MFFSVSLLLLCLPSVSNLLPLPLLVRPSVSLLLFFPCSSVANSSASAYFRVRPWQMLLVISVAHASGSERYVAFVFPKPNFYKGLR